MAAAPKDEKPPQSSPDSASEAATSDCQTKQPEQAASHEESDSSKKYDDVVIEEKRLGVYRMLVAKSKGGKNGSWQKDIDDLRGTIPHLLAFFRDIYSLSPRLLFCVLIWKAWSGLQDALVMHSSTRLLRLVEIGVTTGKPLVADVLWALAFQTFCTGLISYLRWHGRAMESKLKDLVTAHFDLKLMEVKLRLDVPTSLDATSQIEFSGDDAWHAFRDILSYLTGVLSAVSQVTVISRQARASGDPLFVFICVVKPIFESLSYCAIWDTVCYAYADNTDYMRTRALKAFGDGDFKQDILSGDLGAWIIKEYRQARDKLGDISTAHPWNQYFSKESALSQVFTSVFDDLPLAYCGVNAILYPSRFSIASLAIFQSSSSSLRSCISELIIDAREFRKNIQSVEQLYSTQDIQNKIPDGKVAYPGEKTASAGMAFELKDLSFEYPGSSKTSKALDSINLSISAGSLVVIVGSNGSGKSTIVRLLSRLFDPTSGQLLIDGVPAQDYKLADVRQASALLSQENKIYPLTFAENIGLGCLEFKDNMELIKQAAEQGGAADFISKLETGYDTRLDQNAQSWGMNLYGKEDHPLHKKMNELQKSAKISGGETQRLVAARSFMRFNSGKVKLVVVDEPSSALDAEGELQLFQKLIDARAGKTMIFVTHRFGLLTKFADMIICMKDGKIAETGKHEDLMARTNGEYSKLYNIQANAYSEASPSDDEEDD